MSITRTQKIAGASIAALALCLAGCSSDAKDSTKDAATSATAAASSVVNQPSSSEAATNSVTLTKAYVKAKDASTDMTAIFGNLTNDSDKDITLTSVTANDNSVAGMFQLHDVKDGKMQEIKGGIKVPAKQTVKLAPGGLHIMIMDNHDNLAVGDEISVTLHFSDKSTESVKVPVLEQASGEESYDGSSTSSSSMPGMPGMSDSTPSSEAHSH